MQPALSTPIAQPSIPRTSLLSENSSLGFTSKNPTWNPGPNACNSTTAIGMRAGLHLEAIRQTDWARYYAPALGRFISEDPIGFRGGINRYAYVGDSPLNFVDPLGKDKNPPNPSNPPNPPNSPEPCDHLLIDSFSLGIDAVGYIPGAYPVSSLTKSLLGIGAGSAGTLVSSIDKNVPMAILSIGGVQISALELAGLNPSIGEFLNTATTTYDILHSLKDVWNCGRYIDGL
jgi:hypothetical protein